MALYDPKEFPEVEVEQDLAHRFLAFAKSRPADEVFNYADFLTCAYSQFANHIGISRAGMPDHVRSAIHRSVKADLTTCTAFGTFGALADRLEQALAEQAVR